MTRLDCVVDSVGEVCVNETNMLHYMGMIEERTNDILGNYYRRKANKGPSGNLEQQGAEGGNEAKMKGAPGTGPKLQKSNDPMTMNVNPPKLVDYSSDENSGDEGDGSRPLSLEELKAKTMNRMNQPRKKREPSLIMDRRGSILSRRRSSLLLVQVATSIRRAPGISVNHEAIPG